MIQVSADVTRTPRLDESHDVAAAKPMPGVSTAATLPNELWMMCLEPLDAPSAAAARAVSNNFANLIDVVHPELLLPKASRLYQSRPKHADAQAVEKVLGRAKTLTFRASPWSRVITISKPWDVDRCSEPARIWQMIAWAPQLKDLTIAHADALCDLGEITLRPRIPDSLKHLCLEGEHGSMLHSKLYEQVFSGKLSHLLSLQFENVHLVDTPPLAAIRPISLFPQLTSLELNASFWGKDFVEMLLASKIASLQNLTLKGVYNRGEAHGTETQLSLLNFIGRSRVALHRLILDVQPAFEKTAVTRWLAQEIWPNLRNIKICGLHLDTHELNLFDSRHFTLLSRLRLPGTPASQERYRLLGQMPGRHWGLVSLGQDDWIEMTHLTHTSWLAEPAFADYRALRLRLSMVNVCTAQMIIEKLNNHLMSLSLTGLDIDIRSIASLATFFRHAHLPHLQELEITSDFLRVPEAGQVFAEAPFQVWVEDWDEEGMHGRYI